MEDGDIPNPADGFYVVITGANSGLGLGIGRRLIDEFLHTRPQSQSLILITTTRSKQKNESSVEQLRKHLQTTCHKLEKKVPGISMLLMRRVHFSPEIVDLTSLISVQRLAKRLKKKYERLDVVVCNAGIGGWEDLYWGRAVWTVLTGWRGAVTWPTFKKSGVGWVTKAQIPEKEGEKVEEPPLGEVFCANFFGHYLLGHYLAPLLSGREGSENGEETRGRLIWVSSLEAYMHSLDLKDMQSITSTEPYEASKRLTDIMAITSTLPPTAPLVDEYLSTPASKSTAPEKNEETKPRIYLAHPGVCGTTIFPLNIILDYAMVFIFYVARWLGSQWHPVTVYKGACSMVWLTLIKQSTLDNMETQEGVGKWGSATDRWGEERVERTEVEGWGWGGRLGENSKRKGRSPYAMDVTEAGRREFEEMGVECWEKMEGLRREWERRLDEAGVRV